jgi:hypothetical protein
MAKIAIEAKLEDVSCASFGKASFTIPIDSKWGSCRSSLRNVSS